MVRRALSRAESVLSNRPGARGNEQFGSCRDEAKILAAGLADRRLARTIIESDARNAITRCPGLVYNDAASPLPQELCHEKDRNRRRAARRVRID